MVCLSLSPEIICWHVEEVFIWKVSFSPEIGVFKRESQAWIQTECILRTRIPPRFNLPWLISVDGICSTFVAWSHGSMVDIMAENNIPAQNWCELASIASSTFIFFIWRALLFSAKLSLNIRQSRSKKSVCRLTFLSKSQVTRCLLSACIPALAIYDHVLTVQ